MKKKNFHNLHSSLQQKIQIKTSSDYLEWKYRKKCSKTIKAALAWFVIWSNQVQAAYDCVGYKNGEKMRYEGSIYRPPSEAYSLIVQVTIGCAHNDCTFCSMFKDKQFRVRDIEEVLQDLETARKSYKNVG